MAADLLVVDPDKVQPPKPEVIHDLPNNGWRVCAYADAVRLTVINGRVLIEDGNHTGAAPGRVLRNSRHHGQHPAGYKPGRDQSPSRLPTYKERAWNPHDKSMSIAR